jgi:microcystin-dependent protein
MANPYIGEIRAFGFTFAPVGWLQCNGQLVPISEFEALFAILGTTYGGNGTTNFALPNLQGQSPMHWGTSPGLNTVIGQVQGTSMVTLLNTQIPSHTHAIFAGALPTSGPTADRSAGPTSTSFMSEAAHGFLYQPVPATPNTPFAAAAVGAAGNSQPHENEQPYLVLNFCIAYSGIFPTRS